MFNPNWPVQDKKVQLNSEVWRLRQSQKIEVSLFIYDNLLIKINSLREWLSVSAMHTGY